MNRQLNNDEIRERQQDAIDEDRRVYELLGASESGPAGRQVENRPGRRLREILQRLGLTP